MNVIAELTSTLGKYYIVAGLVPALLFTLAHTLLAQSPLGERLPSWTRSLPQGGEIVFPLGEELNTVTTSLLLGALIPIVLGALLMILNHVLIQLFEGRPAWLKRGLLYGFQRRNIRAWEGEGSGKLVAAKEEYWQAYKARAWNYELSEDDDAKTQTLKELQNITQRLVTIEDSLEARRWPRFPARRERVLPTAMGNAWAVIEEYPYRRYGMDGVIYWPRLLPLLESGPEEASFAPSLSSRIAKQKTVFDTLFHSALLAGLLGLEMVILSLFDLSGVWPTLIFHAGALFGGLVVILIAYGLYRAAVDSVYVLGDLFATAYDLLRPALAAALGLTLPTTPEAERRLWKEMGLFLHRGRPYYHPLSLSKQAVYPDAGDESDETGDSDKIEPDLEEMYRVFKVKEPPTTSESGDDGQTEPKLKSDD
jgi:hypothetical protein